MLNLLDLCSLDISFDTEANELLYSDKVMALDHHVVSLQELLPTLLNKSLTYPVHVYEEYHRVYNSCDESLMNSGVNYDVIVIPPGLLGIEYSKTHIFFSPDSDINGKFSSIVEVQYGTLTVLMQRNKPACPCDFESQIEEGYIAKVKPGEKFIVPEGYFYTFINAEDQPLVFTRVYKNPNILDYTLIRRERGLAYYCIRKNGRQELVYNPLYRNTPEIKLVDCNHFGGQIKQDIDHSLYNSLKSKISLFLDVLSA